MIKTPETDPAETPETPAPAPEGQLVGIEFEDKETGRPLARFAFLQGFQALVITLYPGPNGPQPEEPEDKARAGHLLPARTALNAALELMRDGRPQAARTLIMEAIETTGGPLPTSILLRNPHEVAEIASTLERLAFTWIRKRAEQRPRQQQPDLMLAPLERLREYEKIAAANGNQMNTPTGTIELEEIRDAIIDKLPIPSPLNRLRLELPTYSDEELARAVRATVAASMANQNPIEQEHGARALLADLAAKIGRFPAPGRCRYCLNVTPERADLDPACHLGDAHDCDGTTCHLGDAHDCEDLLAGSDPPYRFACASCGKPWEPIDEEADHGDAP